MKDFDALRAEREQRDRSFKIAGHEFRFRPALPAETYSLYLELMDKMSEGRWPEGSFDTLQATMLALLEDDSRDVWLRAVGDNVANPISFEDVADIIDYCVSVQTGRPTQPRSLSGGTGESGSTKSTDGSDSQGRPASPALTSVPG